MTPSRDRKTQLLQHNAAGDSWTLIGSGLRVGKQAACARSADLRLSDPLRASRRGRRYYTNEPETGVEPATSSLQMRRSTN